VLGSNLQEWNRYLTHLDPVVAYVRSLTQIKEGKGTGMTSPAEIPSMAFIEAQVIQHPMTLEACRSVIQEIERQYQVPTGSLGDGIFYQSRILSLLYTLIVFPKEVWSLDQADPFYEEVSRKVDINGFLVQSGKRDFEDPHYNLVHRIRNAVAHANVEFKEPNIIFSDRNGWQATASVEVVWHFLSEIGAIMANLRNSRGITRN
jgi:hypothetical protein